MISSTPAAAQVAADQSGYEQYRKPTRRDEFLATMRAIVPWAALCAVIEPYYPKAGNGRPPVGLERMLRIHFIQHWLNLADLACEEALYDSASLRRFLGNQNPLRSSRIGMLRRARRSRAKTLCPDLCWPGCAMRG